MSTRRYTLIVTTRKTRHRVWNEKVNGCKYFECKNNKGNVLILMISFELFVDTFIEHSSYVPTQRTTYPFLILLLKMSKFDKWTTVEIAIIHVFLPLFW